MIFIDKNTGYCPKCKRLLNIAQETIVLYTWDEDPSYNNREFKDMPILCLYCFEHLGFYNDVEKWRILI
jgi:hypothetical protein